MPPHSPTSLPLEARRAAWARLWERLLAEPPQEPVPESMPQTADDDESLQGAG
jgi:hypothetical protein